MAKEYKGIEGGKALAKELIKFGLHKSEIYQRIKAMPSLQDLDERTQIEVVEDAIEESPNYNLIQSIMKCNLVMDMQMADKEKIKAFNLSEKYFLDISRNRLIDLFNPKFDIKSKIQICEFIYNPFTFTLLGENPVSGIPTYNTYIPPEWMSDYFYSSGNIPIPKLSKIPDIYNKFLMHLVDGKQESYDYILKWLANGLRSRNYCILTTIGDQGIGKGILGSIMQKLFGVSNYYEGADRMFKGTFNVQIANKRLVYCDELALKEKEEENKLKLVVNNFIEIEQKGKDVVVLPNYANFYISSNNIDAISLTEDDRRFSIVDLTSKKLITVFDQEQIKALTDPTNIKDFGQFLWHLPVDEQEMKQVFKTERTKLVRDAALKEWEEWFIYKYCRDNIGKKIEIWEAGEAVKEQFGYSVRIGRTKFDALARRMGSIFKVTLKKNEKGYPTWYLIIGDKNAQSL